MPLREIVKKKHSVLARPVHVSAGPQELAGDTCNQENRKPRSWPTSVLPQRPQERRGGVLVRRRS